MRGLKSVFGVMGALVPVLYCGGLLYYFYDVSGSVKEAETDGLGPTLLGLGAVGLLFCIPLMVKIVRIITGPRSPGSGGRDNGDGPDGENGFDADAAIARYMARQATEVSTAFPAAAPAQKGGGPAARPSFGRRSK